MEEPIGSFVNLRKSRVIPDLDELLKDVEKTAQKELKEKPEEKNIGRSGVDTRVDEDEK